MAAAARPTALKHVASVDALGEHANEYYVHDAAGRPDSPGAEEKQGVRVFINGCWDLLHAGHYNAIRQARQFGSTLIVGVHPNEWIRRIKGGAFVLSEEEKEIMLRGCKYVDEVVHDIPYDEITPDILDREDIRAHFAAHGDDPVVLPSGKNMYEKSRADGRYQEFRRSEGISTTWLINRLIAATQSEGEEIPEANKTLSDGPLQNFTVTSQRLGYFTNFPARRIDQAERVVYIDGDWDFLHVGYIQILEAAAKLGDYLLVGVHGDQVVRDYKSSSMFPVMSLGERSVSLLSCRHVDDVAMAPPVVMNQDFIRALGIKVVIKVVNHSDFVAVDAVHSDRFAVPEKLGLVQELDMSAVTFETRTIVERFMTARDAMMERNCKKNEPTLKEKANEELKA